MIDPHEHDVVPSGHFPQAPEQIYYIRLWSFPRSGSWSFEFEVDVPNIHSVR